MGDGTFERFIDATAVSAILNVSRASAYRLMHQCEHVRLGRVIRVSEAALRKFIEKRTSPGTPAINQRSAAVKAILRGRQLPPPLSPQIRVVYPRTKRRKDPP
jgi:predicted DNA-binding transcriptional regulator AlpA